MCGGHWSQSLSHSAKLLQMERATSCRGGGLLPRNTSGLEQGKRRSKQLLQALASFCKDWIQSPEKLTIVCKTRLWSRW
ncbi:hypothetical protein DV515_00002315 [Chloebia gouldiae]|uniref:Uncharacterized protein n=1 Tax=Chloebia gouldiae TaxID=44316 RepID=A0A3L8SXA5_CHLGU|nr:hypothetical protein DV515_00002315 [Chloebia gouldiae]